MKNLTIAVLTAGLLASSVLAANPAHANNGRGRGNSTKTDSSDSSSSMPVCQVDHLTISGTEATRCIGSFDGNDAGSNAPNTVGLLNDSFGDAGEWSFVQSSNDGLFNHSGNSKDDWSLNSSFSRFQDLASKNYSAIAIALKAANKFSLFTFEGDDLADINFETMAGRFNTVGTSTNGKGNAQGLSHMSLYIVEAPPPNKVPEPFAVVGLAVVGGIGSMLKRHHQ